MSGTKTRDLNWGELVRKSWGKEFTEPDNAYYFTGHIFKDRMTALSGDGIEPVGDGTSLYADNYADDYA